MRRRIILVSMRTFFCFLILYLGANVIGFAQPGDPGGDPDVPISGIEILIVAGGLLGVRKYFKTRNKES
jgi:hypothetical protein